MEQIARRSPSCWHCKIEVTRNLKPQCKCKDKFIHDYCLMIIANTEGKLYCPYCKDRYPLEIRPEPLCETLSDVCYLFLEILFMIFMTCIIALKVYLVLLKVLDLLNVQFLFIVKIISPGIFLWTLYKIMLPIVDRSKEIYQLCHLWYQSTYQWKLIRPSTDNIEKGHIKKVKINKKKRC